MPNRDSLSGLASIFHLIKLLAQLSFPLCIRPLLVTYACGLIPEALRLASSRIVPWDIVSLA